MHKITIFILFLISSPSLLAETFYGIGVTRLNLNDSWTEVRAAIFTVGYKYGKRSFSLSPQLNYIHESNSNIDGNHRITLDHAFLVSLKAQYTFKNGTYLLTTPSIGSFSYRDTGWFEEENDEFEFGLNVGVGYEFSKYFSTELTYGVFKNSNALTAGINFRF